MEALGSGINEVVTFGKYKGQALRSLPENYLQWMVRELDTKWKQLALEVLNQRAVEQGKPVSALGSRRMVTFGKFKGHYLDELPDSQLEWMSREMYSHWARLAQEVLDKRREGGVHSSSTLPADAFKNKIKSCKDLVDARKLHAKLLQSTLKSDRYMANLTVEMYGRCGDFVEARKAFDAISQPNVYSYNIMLKVYADHGCVEEAADLFAKMEVTSLFTWNIMLNAFVKAGDLQRAQRYFKEMRQKDLVSWTTMLAAYVNAGHLEAARSLFDGLAEANTVTWNTLLHGYAKHGQMVEAQKLFDRMPHKKSSITWNIMVDGYGQIGQVENAKRMFDLAPAADKNQVTWNVLLQAYVQTGHFEEAKSIFQEMPSRDEVAWTAMLRCYQLANDLEGAKVLFGSISPQTMVQQTIILQAFSNAGDLVSARGMFDEMHEPDLFAWNSMIAAYARHGHMQEAVAMFERAPQVDVVTWNTMIYAYASTGCCEEAQAIFDRMKVTKDTYTWTALLTGYSQNQRHKEALEVYDCMVLEGVEPNRVVFLAVLASSRQVDQAVGYFKSMVVDYGISPSIDHYSCMVEALTRGKGGLAEAKELIENMPFLPDTQVWMSLLVACKAKGDMVMGKVAAEQVMQLDSKNAAPYVLLGEIYSNLGKDEELDALKRRMKSNRLTTTPGTSSIEIGDQVHKFTVGDKSHLRNKEIRAELVRLTKLIKQEGYLPKGGDYHSEKLAVALGVLASSDRTSTLRVINNLRMCSDCHNWLKLVSKSSGNKIIVRDVQHVHHFLDGTCSCLDDW